MIRYVGVATVARWFGVSPGTVTKWQSRYAESHPCPEPDAKVEELSGWLPEREAEWRAWAESRPGQGVGGGRPAKS